MPQSMSGGNIVQMRNPWEGLAETVNASMSDRANREAMIAQQRINTLMEQAKMLEASEPGAGRAFLATQGGELAAAQRQLLGASRGVGMFLPSKGADQAARNYASDVTSWAMTHPGLGYLNAEFVRNGPGGLQSMAPAPVPPDAAPPAQQGAGVSAEAAPAGAFVSPWGDYGKLTNRGLARGQLNMGQTGRIPYGIGQGFGTSVPNTTMDPDAALDATGVLADPAYRRAWEASSRNEEEVERLANQALPSIQRDYPQLSKDAAKLAAKDYARRALAYNATSEGYYVPQFTAAEGARRKGIFAEGANPGVAAAMTPEARITKRFNETRTRYGSDAEARIAAEDYVNDQLRTEKATGIGPAPSGKQVSQKVVDNAWAELVGGLEATDYEGNQILSRTKSGGTRKSHVAPDPRGKAYIQYADYYIQAALENKTAQSVEEAKAQLYADPQAEKDLEAIRHGTFDGSFVDKALMLMGLDVKQKQPRGFEGEGRAFLQAIEGPLQFEPEQAPPPAGVRPWQAGPVSLAPGAAQPLQESSLFGFTGDIRPLPGSEMAAHIGGTVRSDAPQSIGKATAPQLGSPMQGQTSLMADKFATGLPQETPAPQTFVDKRIDALGQEASKTLPIAAQSATGRLYAGDTLTLQEVRSLQRGMSDASNFYNVVDQKGRRSVQDTIERSFREGTPEERRASMQRLNDNMSMISTENLAMLDPQAASARINERLAYLEEMRLMAVKGDNTKLEMFKVQQEGLRQLVTAYTEAEKGLADLYEKKADKKTIDEYINRTQPVRLAGHEALQILSNTQLPVVMSEEMAKNGLLDRIGSWLTGEPPKSIFRTQLVGSSPTQGPTQATQAGGRPVSAKARSIFEGLK